MTMEISKNADLSRYEIRVDGALAGFAQYRLSGRRAAMPHTEIAPAYEGRGFGSELVRWALDDIRASGLKVVPLCWFVAAFIRHNPEYADLVDA
jgi:predicted GNAT family acetyltransferase